MMCAIEEPQVCFSRIRKGRDCNFSFLDFKHIRTYTALPDLNLHILEFKQVQ